MTYTIALYLDSVPFSRATLAGETSLGGSESAAIGLARALQAAGHQVTIFATKLDADAVGRDADGVVWQPAESLPTVQQAVEWDVFISSRQFTPFTLPVRARLRVLWSEDLLVPGQMAQTAMALAWAYDKIVYVSAYHRQQWEQILPELAPIGWVTKNGYDPSLIPTGVTKVPTRILHTSRPERGLTPLLAMWPALRQAVPDAELRICRYSSMYDPGGWGQVCAQCDREVERVNDEVGGITYLGELTKPELYRELSEAAVLWYPGVVNFGETSCIAAIEAQACCTPIVASYKGALPETAPHATLIRGDAMSAEYQARSVAAVAELIDGCRRESRTYRRFQADGRAHVHPAYTFTTLAREWTDWLDDTFRLRVQAEPLGVLRALLHDDDHVAAKAHAETLGTEPEALAAVAECDRVIRGEAHTADQYAAHACDPELELQSGDPRPERVVAAFAGATHVLDLACGSGAYALALAAAYPEIRVTGMDFAEGNIQAATAAAEKRGVADRVRFIQGTIWDHVQQQPADPLPAGTFDGLFCGEYLEHVADCTGLVDHVETAVQPGATVVFTCPVGPCAELLGRGQPWHKGHVHHFQYDDLGDVFGRKTGLSIDTLINGVTRRGRLIGNWVIRYTADGTPTGERHLAHRILTTRPMPRLSVGILAHKETDLPAALEAVWGIADEIIIGSTDRHDEIQSVADAFGARVLPLTPVREYREGFSAVRNLVMDATTGEWFLWIDTDEQLVGARALRQYLDATVYHGFAIRQVHLHLDAPVTSDRPIRLFRRSKPIQFYGCVHEQPQMGDCNGEIMPALELDQRLVALAHTGYLNEDIRRNKMLHRNLELVFRDQDVFPDRVLGKLLLLRDLVNLADQEREQAGGAITPQVQHYLTQAVGLAEKYFSDPGHRLYPFAKDFYQAALAHVNGAFEFELALGGVPGSLGDQHAQVERVRVRTIDQLERLVSHQLDKAKAAMTPVQLWVDPEEPATEAEATEPEPVRRLQAVS